VTFLLDAKVWSHILNGSSDRLVQGILDAGPRKTTISSINLAELHSGAARSARADADLNRVKTLADELTPYPFDDDSATRLGRLKAQLLSAGRPTPDFDLSDPLSDLRSTENLEGR
jgi:tRNA(fMet)-specific endonuclease VapC